MKKFTVNTVLMNSPFRGFDNIREVYFIGIGGIGMSAIARFFQDKGVKVSGYDRTPTVLTSELEAAGMAVHYEENPELVPVDADLVVYTPAIPASHRELEFYRNNGNRVVKRSDVLQMISESSFNICIAGTHGKTTITTMTSHLLRASGFGCNAFLCGISVNYGTNSWTNERNVCVIEADEYDRSFLKLSPDIAVITAMDADHLDIYGNAESVEQAFIDFSQRLKPGGLLLTQFALRRSADLVAENRLTYSLQHSEADVYADRLEKIDGGYRFDVVMRDNRIEGVRLNMGGMHNAENALAAITVASSLGIDNDSIRKAVESFRGIRRRFEYIIKDDRLAFVDDYAHHPEELKALISGARGLFTDRKCTVIFQPHLFSRTRDFADGFAAALDLADEVILLPIYPARELPMPGVTSDLILDRMNLKAKAVKEKKALLDWMGQYAEGVDQAKGALLITAGAGDIDTLLPGMKTILAKNK